MNKRTWLILAAATLAGVVFAESFSGSLLIRPQWSHTKTGATTTSETFPTALFNWAFTSGVTTNEMNQLWVSRVALTNSQAVTYNLAGGVTNSFGTTLTMARVRMLLVSSTSSNAHPVTIGGAAANAFSAWAGDASDTMSLRPGGIALLVAPDATGYAVNTNGNLKLTNTGTNTVVVDIYAGGSDQ